MPRGSGGSINATGAERFFRNTVRQLRALGAEAPSVSVNRKSFSSTLISRQPVIVTAARPRISADKAAGASAAARNSDTIRFVAASSSAVASAAAFTGAVKRAADLPDASTRAFSNFDDFFDGALTARAADTAWAAVGAGAGATGRLSIAASVSGVEERRGSASIAMTNTATVARAIAGNRDFRRTGVPGRVAEDSATGLVVLAEGGVVGIGIASNAIGITGGAGSGATVVSRRETTARVRLRIDLARRCFFEAFFMRARSSRPTSADTSNVQRRRRPARSRGILIGRKRPTEAQFTCRDALFGSGRDRGLNAYRTVTRLSTLRVSAAFDAGAPLRLLKRPFLLIPLITPEGKIGT